MTTTTQEVKKQYTRFYYLRQPEDSYRYDESGAFIKKIRAGTPVVLIGSTVDRVAGSVSFAVSIAHPKDSFNKKLARTIVRNHLQKKPFIIPIPKTASAHVINCEIMKAILSDEELTLFSMRLNRDLGLSDVDGWKNTVWVNRRFGHQGLRRLASYWLEHPRYIKPSSLLQAIKDEFAKDPATKDLASKELVNVLLDNGFLNNTDRDSDKIAKFDVLQKLLLEDKKATA